MPAIIRFLGDRLNKNEYAVTAMDGETFGHHRPGLEKLLFNIFETPDFHLVTISDLLSAYHDEIEVEPLASTWASSKEDIDRGVQFLSWTDPDNNIHTWQWKLFNLVRSRVHVMDPSHPSFKEVRQKMDTATSSDHFWWASAKPWWSIEMIEFGAYALLDVLYSIPNMAEEQTCGNI